MKTVSNVLFYGEAKSPESKLSQTGQTADLKTKPPSTLDLVEQVIAHRYAEAQKLSQKEREKFLNEPMAQLDGQPFTGLDLLKLIDSATEKRWMKRDWLWICLNGFLASITFGILPMADPLFRMELVDATRKGLPEVELTRLLTPLITKRGESLDYESVRRQLVGLGLARHTASSDRVLLSPIAREILA